MFKMKNITKNGSVVSMLVLINCREDKAYSLTLETSGERVSIIETELPDEELSLVGKIECFLRDYNGNELPSEKTIAWY